MHAYYIPKLFTRAWFKFQQMPLPLRLQVFSRCECTRDNEWICSDRCTSPRDTPSLCVHRASVCAQCVCVHVPSSLYFNARNIISTHRMLHRLRLSRLGWFFREQEMSYVSTHAVCIGRVVGQCSCNVPMCTEKFAIRARKKGSENALVKYRFVIWNITPLLLLPEVKKTISRTSTKKNNKAVETYEKNRIWMH